MARRKSSRAENSVGEPPDHAPTASHEDLKAEYILLQNFYEDYDKRALSIKALGTPLLGIGIVAGLKEGSPLVITGTIAVALCLWILETIWKTFQRRHQVRILALEGRFRGYGPDTAPFQIFTSWMRTRQRYRDIRLWLRLAFAPFVMLPYVVVLAIGLAALPATLSLDRLPESSTKSTTVPVVGEKDAAPVRTVRDDRQQPVDRAGDSAVAGVDWIQLTGISFILVLVLWLANRLRLQRHVHRVNEPDSGEAPPASGSGTVTLLGALSAAGAAWTAIGRVDGGWKLSLPFLIAPLITFAAASWPVTRPYKRWALVAGIVGPIVIVIANMIDRRFAGQSSLWLESFAENAEALLAQLSFTDLGSLFVALVAYTVALAGTGASGRR